jgi:hypothetical protein
MSQGAQRFAINPAARLRVETTAAGTPVLIVDDFYADPHAVRASALDGKYDASLAYYPGMHSRIDPADSAPLFESLTRLLALLGDVRARPEYFWTDFSIVTTPAAQMLAKQKHPHVDPTPLAGIVYLNPDYEIGTCFFRHAPTGLAVMRTPEESAQFTAWMEEFGEQFQPETYAVGDDGTWQRLHTLEGRFNRLVMYPGNAFHSIDMRDVAANPTMAGARLTQRFFVGKVDNLSAPT